MKQDMIVILDLGSHENTVVARAIRALGVYSEIYPHDITAAELKALPNVKGIIINGGPNNVIDGVAIDVLPEIYEAGFPVMAAGHDKALCEVKLAQFANDEEAIKAAVKDFVFDTCKAEANWNMKNFVADQVELIRQQDEVQFIWQTGSFYKNEIADALRRAGKPENLIVTDFIADMAAAYTVADLVISRAGAGSISEFCLLGKPVILVPSPNVAEDHQTKNALALVKKGAAVYIKDDEARQALIPRAIALVQEPLQLKELSDNILPLAKPNAAMDIAREVLKLAQS